MSEFTSSDFGLIEGVEKYSVIWDTTNINHKNKRHVKSAWQSIAAILNEPVDVCERRWYALRQRYGKERRKYMGSGAAGDAGVVSEYSEWPLYKSMTFLDRVFKSRKSTGMGRGAPRTSEVSSPVHFNLNSYESYDDDATNTTETNINIGYEQMETQAESKPNTSECASDYVGKVHRENKRRKTAVENALNNLSSSISTAFDHLIKLETKEAIETNNVNYAFGRHLALLLEELPQEEQSLMRRKIMKTFYE